jgi:hypothetical protein
VPVFLDLTGQKFGRLSVLRRAENRGKKTCWECLCECGNIIITQAWSLRSGHTCSCGCIRIEDLVHARKETHPKILAQRKIKYKQSNLNAFLLRKYKISSQDYEEMLQRQNGLCAICGMEMRPPHIDHSHATTNVRELLCRKCNFLLGHANDDIVILQKAIAYLEKHNEQFQRSHTFYSQA